MVVKADKGISLSEIHGILIGEKKVTLDFQMMLVLEDLGAVVSLKKLHLGQQLIEMDLKIFPISVTPIYQIIIK